VKILKSFLVGNVRRVDVLCYGEQIGASGESAQKFFTNFQMSLLN